MGRATDRLKELRSGPQREDQFKSSGSAVAKLAELRQGELGRDPRTRGSGVYPGSTSSTSTTKFDGLGGGRMIAGGGRKEAETSADLEKRDYNLAVDIGKKKWESKQELGNKDSAYKRATSAKNQIDYIRSVSAFDPGTQVDKILRQYGFNSEDEMRQALATSATTKLAELRQERRDLGAEYFHTRSKEAVTSMAGKSAYRQAVEADANNDRKAKDEAVQKLIDAGFKKDDIDRALYYEERLRKEQKAAETQQKLYEFANQNLGTGAASVLGRTALTAVQGLDYITAFAKSIGHSDLDNLDRYRPISSADLAITGAKQALEGGVTDQARREIDNPVVEELAVFGLQLGMSVADSVVYATTAGSTGAALILGSAAASAATKDAVDRGATNAQALAVGLAAGVAEAAFEKYSLEKALSPDVPVTKPIHILENAWKHSGVELSEEMATEITNILVDTAIMGRNSNSAIAKRQYMEQGMSEVEASQKVFLDNAISVVLAGVGGLLTGGAMSAVFGTSQYNQYKAEQRQQAPAAAPQANATQQTPATEQKPTQESVSAQQGVVSPTMQENAQSATVADSARVGNVGQTITRTAAQSNVQNMHFAPGLVQNEFSAKLDAPTAKLLDTMGKITNTPIVIEAQVNGGKSNGSYGNGVIRLAADAKNPLLVVGKHEITHRMKETALNEYLAFRDHAVRMMSAGSGDIITRYQQQAAQQGVTLSREGAMDEIAADFTEKIFTDEAQLDMLLEEATKTPESRNMVQRFFDFVREFLSKVRNAVKGEAVPGWDMESLERAERKWADLVKASARTKKNTAAFNGDVKYQAKNSKKDPNILDPKTVTREDVVEMLKAAKDGKYSENTYIPVRISTPGIVQERLFAEDLPIIMPVSKIIQAFSKDNGPVKGKNARGHEFGVDDIISIIERMDSPDFVYSQDNDRGVEVIKLGDDPNSTAVIVEFGNNVNPVYMNGFEGGAYNVSVTTFDVDGGDIGLFMYGQMKGWREVFNKQKEGDPAKKFPATRPFAIEQDSLHGDALNGAPPNYKIAHDGKNVNSLKAQTDVFRARIEELNKEYGTIKRGENPARDIQVPKRTAKDNKVSQTIRTVLEAGATPDEALPTIEKMIADGDFSYEVYGDKQAIKDAENFVKHRGWGDATREWFDRMKKGEVSKKNTAIGWTLYNNAVNSKDMETAIDILNAMVEHQRNAAQAVQATRILKKMSPEGQLYAAQKSVQRLQEELNERYGKKTDVELKIDPALAEELMEAEDQKARDKVLQKIYKDIGRQIPSRFIDKWNAWRYLAMLGNPRTHVRNIMGNAFFAPVVATKNLTATAIESAVNRVTGGKTGRTKSIVSGAAVTNPLSKTNTPIAFGTKEDKARLLSAWADYADVAESAMDGGKYSDSANANKYIQEGRQIFGRSDQAKNKIARAVSGTVGKGVEAARTFNSKALEVEDKWFSQPHYAAALASYCKANGITAEQMKNGGITDEARAYAIKEAQKATYRDANMLSDFFGRIGRYEGKNKAGKFVSTVIEGILPFRKTPANILARGLEYSPIGLIKSISYDLVQVKNGDMSATQLIDNLSAGLTGTGLLALGAFLAAQGLVRGAGGEDKDKEEFEDLMGHQNYALEIGGKSFTLDWLAPEALPFFVGVNLWEVGEESKGGRTLADWLTAISNVSEPMMEMSCLQSLNDVFDSVGYASSNGLSGATSALASAATSYLTQGIPTLLGQLERSAQDTRMTTYTDKNKKNLTGDMQYAIGSASGKIPGLDYNQIAYIDAWGRTESTGSLLGRILNTMANPSYVSAVDESKMEKELMRLYNSTSDPSVFPNRASKYFSVGGKRIDLNGAQYVSYAKKKGQTAYNLLADLTKSSAYAKLTDTDKAKAVGLVYDYANAVAKAHVSKYELEGWIRKADKSRDVVSYILKEKVGK